ncbi:MAG: fumarylacetoacetate hydrolase family protein [Chloroflexi bacterium]|nr:fumarylacetoacetate hydrolase family protein [Chloroflexota bacterium]
MRFVRFLSEGKARYGLVEGDEAIELRGDILGWHQRTRARRKLSEIRFLPPCCPSKIMAIGLNYADHAAEGSRPVPKQPILFLKSPGALIGHGDSIVLTDQVSRIDHEAELAVIIKDCIKNVTPEEALEHVLGYTCCNDVSHRPFQRAEGGQWCRGKSLDTFCPLGPYIVTDVDPRDLKIECRVNGQIRQSSRTSKLVFDVPYLISFLSQGMTLFPGDVLTTGTTAGVSPLKTGDVVEVIIEGIGTLRNPVE